MEDLKAKIREVPDFPVPGILFYDVTTLLKDAEAFRQAARELAAPFEKSAVDKVLGIESRGFIFGPLVAFQLGAGFVPVRKKGKLPAEKLQLSYQLEYGTDALEIHRDAVAPGEKVLVVDDLIATGGTAAATGEIVRQLGGHLSGFAFLIELTALEGRKKLPPDVPFVSILRY
ncbi:MAG TPA: adenine phosphoribosyltransferase [Acidobacteriota bacterium]|jgi:adenine phosphoribosyltransferase|nr:adenine phosphoribosyltransferase [Acidobacteriota bacterium]HRV08340.1 adenine phosphoribosyltransferase [Acidobacteriota bacterium]